MKQKTDEERRVLVEEWRSSGETISRFCRRKGISRESLMRWKRRPGVGMEHPLLTPDHNSQKTRSGPSSSDARTGCSPTRRQGQPPALRCTH